jgi:hypothetical protein
MFRRWSSALTACYFSFNSKRKVTKRMPFRDVFYLALPNHFLTHHLRHYIPVLAEVREKKGHAELSPLMNLNCRSIRSMFSLAKVFVQHKKNVRKFPSRIGFRILQPLIIIQYALIVR